MVAPTSTGIVHVVSLSGAVHINIFAVSPLTVPFAKILTMVESSAFPPPNVSVPSAVRTATASIEDVVPTAKVPTASTVAMASNKEVALIEVTPRVESGSVEKGDIENILIHYS